MRIKLTAIISLCFVVLSCSNDKLDVDVSNVNIDVEYDRFESDMFKGNSPENLYEINSDFIKRGGQLYEFYMFEMLRMGSVYNDSIGYFLMPFVQDSMMKLVFTDIEAEFSNFSEIEQVLTSAFKHLKYHLPNAPLPQKIITYNGTFVYGVVSTDSVIGIGLEMYLGEENKIVKEIRFPIYMKSKMNRNYLPVDVAQSWLMTNVIGEERGETFLSNMIYHGKLRYAIEAMLPDIPDEFIIRYTAEEYGYALASEYNVWQYLVDMDWIYTTDMKVKLRFFEEAPTTVGIDESPGRMGQFMGWQMVRSYMAANPDVSLEQLLNETNETKILKAYKPRENE